MHQLTILILVLVLVTIMIFIMGTSSPKSLKSISSKSLSSLNSANPLTQVFVNEQVFTLVDPSSFSTDTGLPIIANNEKMNFQFDFQTAPDITAYTFKMKSTIFMYPTIKVIGHNGDIISMQTNDNQNIDLTFGLSSPTSKVSIMVSSLDPVPHTINISNVQLVDYVNVSNNTISNVVSTKLVSGIINGAGIAPSLLTEAGTTNGALIPIPLNEQNGRVVFNWLTNPAINRLNLRFTIYGYMIPTMKITTNGADGPKVINFALSETNINDDVFTFDVVNASTATVELETKNNGSENGITYFRIANLKLSDASVPKNTSRRNKKNK